MPGCLYETKVRDMMQYAQQWYSLQDFDSSEIAKIDVSVKNLPKRFQ